MINQANPLLYQRKGEPLLQVNYKGSLPFIITKPQFGLLKQRPGSVYYCRLPLRAFRYILF